MNNAVKVIASLVVIVACAVVIRCQTRPPRGSAPNHEFAGALVAKELVKLRGDKGGKVLLVGFTGERLVLNQQIDGFLGELKNSEGFEVIGREDIDPEAKGEGMIMEGGGLPSADFLNCVQPHKEADIVVSFVGLPDFRDARVTQYFRNGPKLVVLNSGAPELRGLIEGGLVHLAVVNKSVDMSQFSKSPASPAAWFDRFFEIVAAETATAK